ncbi:MAG TPA: ABC transporter permease, partial [Candidatus Dormibacteraeota bacterium]|nr:ABC transporter permease [Candidatus Dormibacteraeota bacterium]
MDSILHALNSIPVLGLVFQFIEYFVQDLPFISHVAVQLAVPICLAALCGVMCERSGVVNIGLEGIMLTCAFTGWFAGAVLTGVMGPGTPTPVFGLTAPLVLGLFAAIIIGMLISLLHAWLSISVRADQIIAGAIINILALGLTGYMNTLLATTALPPTSNFAVLSIPSVISGIPLIGWLINSLFGQGPIGVLMIIIVVVFQIFLFRSRWGLRTRAVGEHPRAAETVGIDVIRVRYRNVVLSGVLAALSGAYLSMEATNGFQAGMSQGRGFIGLAAMIVGRWTPLGAFGAALLFAASQAISQTISISPPQGELGTLVGRIPTQFFDALPYLITIVILA